MKSIIKGTLNALYCMLPIFIFCFLSVMTLQRSGKKKTMVSKKEISVQFETLNKKKEKAAIAFNPQNL
jgi:amino acid permease